jgi:hypothetical protein
MKSFLLVIYLFIGACAQLQRGQEQPVISKLSKEKGEYYFTTCGGAVEGWSDCFQKAQRTCPAGYIKLSTADNSRGTQRDLTFQCKK